MWILVLITLLLMVTPSVAEQGFDPKYERESARRNDGADPRRTPLAARTSGVVRFNDSEKLLALATLQNLPVQHHDLREIKRTFFVSINSDACPLCGLNHR